LEKRNWSHDGGLTVVVNEIIPVMLGPPKQEEDSDTHFLRGTIQEEKEPIAASVSELFLRW
jgi:hypothetical protein